MKYAPDCRKTAGVVRVDHMNYSEVPAYLNAIELMGINPGLKTVRTILESLPLSDRLASTAFIQVAGTNGKGSTSLFIAGALDGHNYKTGLFTSPHLNDVRERITIGKQMIWPEDFCRAVEVVKETSESLLAKGKITHMPTYFEYTFLTAMHYFCLKKVDVAVLEVGLGGRWDATSVITPDVSVITTIGRDHTRFLGTRLTEIAAEKAAIIKEGIPVVCGCGTRTTAFKVIKAAAQQNNAPFFSVIDNKNKLEIQEDDCNSYTYTTHFPQVKEFRFGIGLNGAHQGLNAATAIKALQVFAMQRGLSLSESSLYKGLKETRVPARIETMETEPQVILDAGHNVQSTTALAQFLLRNKKRGMTLVFGVLADKNYRKMMRLLLPHTGRVILTRPQSKRALPPAKIVKWLPTDSSGNPVMVRERPEEAYQTARQFNKEILITGSFYLVGAVRQLIINHLKHANSQEYKLPGGSDGPIDTQI